MVSSRIYSLCSAVWTSDSQGPVQNWTKKQSEHRSHSIRNARVGMQWSVSLLHSTMFYILYVCCVKYIKFWTVTANWCSWPAIKTAQCTLWFTAKSWNCLGSQANHCTRILLFILVVGKFNKRDLLIISCSEPLTLSRIQIWTFDLICRQFWISWNLQYQRTAHTQVQF